MSTLLYGSSLSAPTYKVALMLALTGTPYDWRPLNLRGGDHKQPEFLAINRFGQVPALVDGAVQLCQSNVILQYLAEKTGQFKGTSTEDYWRAKEWQAWEADRLMPGILRPRFFKRFMKVDPSVMEYFRGVGEAALGVLNAQLENKSWLVGTMPTIADITCYMSVAYAHEADYDLAGYSHISAWKLRLEALTNFKAPSDLLPQPTA